MASLTVRNIEDDVKAALRLRAARHGVSMENEIRSILRTAARAERVATETDEDRAARVARMIALGRPSPEPFDLKRFSDALEDGTE